MEGNQKKKKRLIYKWQCQTKLTYYKYIYLIT